MEMLETRPRQNRWMNDISGISYKTNIVSGLIDFKNYTKIAFFKFISKSLKVT